MTDPTIPVTPDAPGLAQRVSGNASFIRAALRNGQLLDPAELAAVANTLEAAAEALLAHEAAMAESRTSGNAPDFSEYQVRMLAHELATRRGYLIPAQDLVPVVLAHAATLKALAELKARSSEDK